MRMSTTKQNTKKPGCGSLAYLRNAFRIRLLHALNEAGAELTRDDALARATAVSASVRGGAVSMPLAKDVPDVVDLGDAA
jgi:hypothetical protein